MHFVIVIILNPYQASLVATCESRHDGQYSSDAKLQNSKYMYSNFKKLCAIQTLEVIKTILCEKACEITQ